MLGELSTTTDFNYNSKDNVALGSGMFFGAKMNASFQLPEKMDYIPTGFFQQAVFPVATELAMVTNNFPKITALAAGAFQAARITFNLDNLKVLTDIYNGAFREAKIVGDLSKFVIPNKTYTTYEDSIFFGANADTTDKEYEYGPDGLPTLVQKVDDYGLPVFRTRTVK